MNIKYMVTHCFREDYAWRQGYDLTRDNECPWVYKQEHTEDAWRMFHVGHVKGRSWG